MKFKSLYKVNPSLLRSCLRYGERNVLDHLGRRRVENGSSEEKGKQQIKQGGVEMKRK